MSCRFASTAPALPVGKRTTAEAIDYSFKRQAALMHFIDNGDVAANNNRIKNLIRPITLGRKKGCSLAACGRAKEQRPA